MLIGVPKEIKNHEYRVGMTPTSVKEAVRHGHEVLGRGQCRRRHRRRPMPTTSRPAAKIVATAAEIFAKADMIVKVKEPQAVERKMLRPGQILYTYLHLAPDPEQTKDLVASGAVCIAYETVTRPRGGLPLLAPMSQVAGPHVGPVRRALPREGARRPRRAAGRRSRRCARPRWSSSAAASSAPMRPSMALGMGADVTILEKSTDRMEELVARFGTAHQDDLLDAGRGRR